IIGQSTEYYTADEYKPTQGIASQAPMGAATVIIEGLAVGMLSSGIPVVTIVVGILCAFGFAGGFGSDPGSMSLGLYGVGFAAVGMLATLGITLATDAYGPIADNAGGNAEMSGLDPSVRIKTDNLDMLGNTTAATGKGFAIGSAALTAMALLAAYLEEVRTWLGKFANEAADKIVTVGGVPFTNSPAVAKTQHAVFLPEAQITDFLKAFHLNIMNPLVICGLFLGAMAAFVFCALTMKAVGRAAGKMVNEVRRQFREIPGIMEGKAKPDYARCVEISTAGAQREMMVPSFLAIILPLATGIVLGVQGVMGLLAGALAAGFSLACLLNNAGGAWDNGKKFIEKGNFGGKFITDEQGNKIKNPAHGAAVIGDTVGDPCKDTAGPSLNILIKLMSMGSVVFAGLVVWMTVFHRIVG
ncbi:MAG TPA: sodium-translocating pyrophosphatase, partial [Planctomycetes bacterium]|nr:sodium-translocating pyrophosphatase [Planctomycetota bacterium]